MRLGKGSVRLEFPAGYLSTCMAFIFLFLGSSERSYMDLHSLFLLLHVIALDVLIYDLLLPILSSRGSVLNP